MTGGAPRAPRWCWTSLRFSLLPGHFLQLGVPGLPELADQRLLDEPMDGHLERFPQGTGRIADRPAVVVDRGELGVLPQPYGVQVAGDRFFPGYGPRRMGRLDPTFGHPIVGIYHIGTFVVVHQGGLPFPVLALDIGALGLDGPDALLPEKGFDLFVDFLQDGGLPILHRGTVFPPDTTGPFAGAEVAHKILFQD